MSEEIHSNWTTQSRYNYARREAGQLTLIHHRGVFLLLTDKVEPLPEEVVSLDEAITACDVYKPPSAWSFVVGLWVRPGWKVKREEEGHWMIYDESGELKSKKKFGRADQARKWCEVRQDRVGLNLRGPKPKPEKTEPSDEPSEDSGSEE